jgi:hypothetical protein
MVVVVVAELIEAILVEKKLPRRQRLRVAVNPAVQ